MNAILIGGPAHGDSFALPATPPNHLDIEDADELLLDVPQGGKYEHCPLAKHRYLLTKIDRTSTLPGPQALYGYVRKLPS
jgi:hypothetical protein